MKLEKILQQGLSFKRTLDIILGDFNMNVRNNENILHILQDYRLLYLEPKHISGYRIDHIYFKNSTYEPVDVSFSTKAK